MMNDELKGRTALVTGASSGMGVDYARELARRGANLILVARRRDALERVAKEMRDHHGVEVRVTPADLSDASDRERLFRELEAEGSQVDMLLNNAGFGLFGKFAESDWERVNQMLQIDIVALSHLTRLFTLGMTSLGPDSADCFHRRFPTCAHLCGIWRSQELRPFLGCGTQSRTAWYRGELHGGLSWSDCH